VTMTGFGGTFVTFSASSSLIPSLFLSVFLKRNWVNIYILGLILRKKNYLKWQKKRGGGLSISIAQDFQVGLNLAISHTWCLYHYSVQPILGTVKIGCNWLRSQQYFFYWWISVATT